MDSKADVLIADVLNRQKKDRRWGAGYIPDPTTYLNQERWDDAVEAYDTQLNRIPNPNQHKELEEYARWKGIGARPGESYEDLHRRCVEATR